MIVNTSKAVIAVWGAGVIVVAVVAGIGSAFLFGDKLLHTIDATPALIQTVEELETVTTELSTTTKQLADHEVREDSIVGPDAFHSVKDDMVALKSADSAQAAKLEMIERGQRSIICDLKSISNIDCTEANVERAVRVQTRN